MESGCRHPVNFFQGLGRRIQQFFAFLVSAPRRAVKPSSPQSPEPFCSPVNGRSARLRASLAFPLGQLDVFARGISHFRHLVRGRPSRPFWTPLARLRGVSLPGCPVYWDFSVILTTLPHRCFEHLLHRSDTAVFSLFPVPRSRE